MNLNTEQIKSLAVKAAFFKQREKFFRINYCDEHAFCVVDEDRGDEHVIQYSDVTSDDEFHALQVLKVEGCITDSNPHENKARVLVIVRGGVADYVADDGAEVHVFDFDNYNADPEYTSKAPAHFFDLAAPVDIPCEV